MNFPGAVARPMSSGRVRLEADELAVTRGDKAVLKGLSFAVAAGEVFGLLGGNGVGKSTTLLSFLGFLDPVGGTVKVNGAPVRDNVAAARRAIAYLPESSSLYGHLNARENLRYFLRLAGSDIDEAAVEAALDRVALHGDARTRRLAEYSRGMSQKVAIALAILRDSDALLLDEPTSGLDPTAIDEFHGVVRGLADAGKSVLMVTHDVYGACQVADRIGLLRDGRLAGDFSAPAGGRIDTEAVHRAFSTPAPA